jgi:peptidoglycan/LPS O-acetylase OafA/YrhL
MVPPNPKKAGMSPTDKFYLPSLDGVRAIAAMLVFVSHAGLGHLVPGGLGVTIFFFLSGYLITTLLRREYESTGTISFRHFYLRRVYRIFPPMYLVLFSILALGLLGLVPHTATWSGLLSQVFQVTNYFVLNSVDESGLVYSTGTYWSLAVEEHFYIIFPVSLLFCLRRWRYANVAKILLLACLAELAWRCILVYVFHAPAPRTYLATDTRLDSMLFGCILGLWRNPALDPEGDRYPLVLKALVLAGAVALLAATLVIRHPEFRETLRYTLQGVACFPLFWLAVRHPKWPVFAPLNSAPFVLLGKISYTFYLCHFFFVRLAETLFTEQIVIALTSFAASFAFAYLVYRTVEQPFARLRRRLHD